VVYRLVIESTVLYFVLSRRLTERRFVIRTFDALAADPIVSAIIKKKPSEGRLMEVILVGKYLVTY